MRGALSDQTESQLLQYPMGKLVDVIDSWSMHYRVWRSEVYARPEQAPAPYVEDFETVYAEIKERKREERCGVGLAGSTYTGSSGYGLVESIVPARSALSRPHYMKNF